MRSFLCGMLAIGLSAGMRAQAVGQTSANTTVAQEPGYATGHITCGDTQRPARVAKVRFLPLPAAIADHPGHPKAPIKTSSVQAEQDFGVSINPVETDMDGNFVVRNLKPGRYIVRVDMGGYLTPLLSFSAEDLGQPDEATRARMHRDLEIVDIRSRAETRVDVTLQRGATLAGTVSFDDGSPAIGLGTELLEKNAKGEWVEAKLSGIRFGSTDGRGRYQIDAVPPGSYLVRANLSLNEHSFAVMQMPTNGTEMHVSMTKTIFSLPVFSGSALRERDATPIKVEGSGVYDGNDISLPISKLHRVSGALLAGDGHPLNGGKVILRYPDDHSEVASVSVSKEDRQFHFPYVPEGTYTLAVEDARDVTEVEVPNAPGVTPKMRVEEKTLRRYEKVEQPLVVQSDVEGVLATVQGPAKGDGSSGATASP